MSDQAQPTTPDLDPLQIEKLANYIARGGVYAKRGLAYAKDGAVKNLRIGPQTIRAEVRGSYADAYETQLAFINQQWRGTCTCPFGENCKHSYAVAHLARSAIASRQSTSAATTQPAKKSFRETWMPIVAKKLGRSLSPR